MKRLTALLFAAILTLSGLVPAANAVGVYISAGDRPYYTHGPYYYDGPRRYVWAPGHWTWRHHHRVWVHGYYGP
jgi:YXWGXW repeat-containing protein